MTKGILTLPKRHISYLLKMSTRRFPSGFHNRAYRSDGGKGGKTETDEEDKRDELELLTAIDERITKALETRATKEELEAIRKDIPTEFKGMDIEKLRAMADDKTGAMTMLAAQGLELQRLKTQMASQPEDLSIRSQVAKWHEKNKEAITQIRAGKKQELPELEIRAVASPMSFVSVNATSSPYIGTTTIESGVNELVRPLPVFWDYIVKGRTNSNTYGWVNKTPTEGAASFIAPGVLKPGISFGLVAETSVAKKIADSAKTTTELLDDIDGMVTFIEQELKYQVMIKVNSELMVSPGSSVRPTGIQALSVAYTTATIKTINPTYMDAIRAVVGQMRSGWLTGDITVFVNSIDAANMDLSKAQDSGVYLLPPFSTANGKTIGGATIVEDNNVPVGSIQGAFLRFYRILIYKDFTVSWGWENDDFTKNLVTAIGEMRLHQFFNDIYNGAFVFDTFANVIAAITPAP